MPSAARHPKLPVKTATFEVDSAGTLKSREPPQPVRFTFQLFGLAFQAEATFQADNPKLDGHLRIRAQLGRLPFTIEAENTRHLIMRIVRASATLPHVRIGVDQGQALVIEGTRPTPSPSTPKSLVTDATMLIMEIKPLLERYLSLSGELVTRAGMEGGHRGQRSAFRRGLSRSG